MKKGFTPKNSFWNFKGFTLLELLITIIILGILAAIAIPNYTNSVEQRRGEACMNNIRVIFAAEKIYRIKNGALWPNDTGVSLEPQTITEINNALGTAISDSYFDYSFQHSPTTSNVLDVSASKNRSPYLGGTINYSGDMTGSTFTWTGSWFIDQVPDPPNFPLPTN